VNCRLWQRRPEADGLRLTVEMKFIIIHAMHGFPRKLLVLILSLMLALVPLQGLFASEMSMPAGHMAKSPTLQAQTMQGQSMMDVVTDCRDCAKESKCCSGNTCSSHQCASCVVMAFLPVSFLFQAPESAGVSSAQPDGKAASTHTLLYRPPQV